MYSRVFILFLSLNVGVALSPLNIQDKTQYTDCQKLNDAGYKSTGFYELWYNMNETWPYMVECEMVRDNGYTMIQRRMYGNENFYRGFRDYQFGFGNPQGDFWLGLYQIHQLTSTGNTILTINMQDWNGNNKNARYNYFRLMDNIHFYLNIGGFYSADVVDDLSLNNGYPFATYDKPDANYCAINQKSGWWFNYCSYALPNGIYYLGGAYIPSSGYYDGIYWKDWLGYGYSLKTFTMQLSNI